MIVDFTRPEATLMHIEIARKTGTAMVIGTTGFTKEQEKALTRAAADTPIVYCANTSVGVTLLSQIVRQVAGQLGEDWDIEVVETHHNQKIDAPSGTALALGRAAADGRNVNLDEVRDSGRDGVTGQRRQGDIGFTVMRGGDVAGEHTVYFFWSARAHRADTSGRKPGYLCPWGTTRCCICLFTDPRAVQYG